MDKDGFLRDLLNDYADGCCGALDGELIQDLLVKHGFAVLRPLTEAESQEAWVLADDLEPGDEVAIFTDEMQALMKPGK